MCMCWHQSSSITAQPNVAPCYASLLGCPPWKTSVVAHWYPYMYLFSGHPKQKNMRKSVLNLWTSVTALDNSVGTMAFPSLWFPRLYILTHTWSSKPYGHSVNFWVAIHCLLLLMPDLLWRLLLEKESRIFIPVLVPTAPLPLSYDNLSGSVACNWVQISTWWPFCRTHTYFTSHSPFFLLAISILYSFKWDWSIVTRFPNCMWSRRSSSS